MPSTFVKFSFELSLGPRSFLCSVSNLLSVAQGTVKRNKLETLCKRKFNCKKGTTPKPTDHPRGTVTYEIKVVVTVATAKKLKRIGSLVIPFRTVIGGPVPGS